MGQVFRGSVREADTPVAVKILKPELVSDPDIVARFFQERSILLSITHPNVVRVLDLVVEGQTLGIVMELVEGQDLRHELLARHTLAPTEAVRYSRELLDGLEAVHRSGVVHRDVKPENLLVDTKDGEPRLKLTDFGVARLTYGGSLTKISSLIGTPEYMAPEITDHETATAASDLYSAGILLYEMLSGRTPFAGGHVMAVLRRHLDDAPPPIPGAPAELWALIESLLAKDPDARPRSAAETAEALAALAPSLTDLPALPPMPAPTFPPAAPRRAAYPQPQAVHQPSSTAAPDYPAPRPATAANLTIDAPTRPPGQTPIPTSQTPVPARPWFRRPSLVTASAVTLAGLVTIAVIALVGHGRSATTANPVVAKGSHTATHASPSPTTPSPAPTAVTSLAILPSAIQMFQNQTIELNLEGQLADGSSASEQALAGATWTSEDPAIASVSGTGLVTATGTGSTYITASLGGALASASLVVASNPSTPTANPGVPASYTYQVFHTCRGPQHVCGLEVRSGPGTAYAATQLLHNNDVVQIVCQTTGEWVTNSKGVSSQVWDKLSQGGYVSDLYIDTPGARVSPTESGFTSSIPRC
jgi:serine/threonine-protein kinase